MWKPNQNIDKLIESVDRDEKGKETTWWDIYFRKVKNKQT
jgi:hypothetical protein